MIDQYSATNFASHPPASFPQQRNSLWWRWRRAFTHLLLLATGVALVTWNIFLAYELATDLRLNDFGRFYYSATAFLHGQDMYSPRPAALLQIKETPERQLGNMNPPHFHLLMLPFALLPPGMALVCWGGISILSLLVSLRLIMRETGLESSPQLRWTGLLGILGFSGTGMVLLTGQLSLLLLLPITLAWVAARGERWTSTSIYLGLAMSIKPFLLIFLPYFICRRQFQAAAVTIITILLCFTAGILIFGIQSYQGWLQALAAIHWVWGSTNASILGFLTRVLSATPSFSPLLQAPLFIEPLWIVIAGAVGLLTLFIASVDSTKMAVDRGFALLFLAALLISPLGWSYYWWLPFGPLIALFTCWRRNGELTFHAISLVRWRNGFLVGAAPGLVSPFLIATSGRGYAWATASLGSLYFWTTAFLWLSLLIDWRVAIKKEGRE